MLQALRMWRNEASMNPKDNDELREQILFQGEVSFDTYDKDSRTARKLVKIPIDDLMHLISNREKLVRIDEGETIKATYGVWYNKLSKKHGVKREIPHTAFHQIIEERITTLRKELDTQTQEEET